MVTQFFLNLCNRIFISSSLYWFEKCFIRPQKQISACFLVTFAFNSAALYAIVLSAFGGSACFLEVTKGAVLFRWIPKVLVYVC